MIPELAYVVMAAAGVAVVWGVTTAILDKPPGKAQLLYSRRRLAGDPGSVGRRRGEAARRIPAPIAAHHDRIPDRHCAADPIGLVLGQLERTRFSGIVLAVAALAVAAMTLRLLCCGSRRHDSGRRLGDPHQHRCRPRSDRVYGLFALAATARASVQLATRYSEAPLAYLLSAVAGVIYIVATFTLARGSRTSRRIAWAAILLELVGVLTVGTLSLVDPAAFPRATVGRCTASVTALCRWCYRSSG